MKLFLLLLMLYQQADAFYKHMKEYNHTKPKEDALKVILDQIYGTTNINNCSTECGKRLFLTPYIEANQTDKAKKAALVDPKIISVPGVDSYAGYLTVDKAYNSNSFMWYFVSKNAPNDRPVLAYFQGGPGVPAVYGLFPQLGPLELNSKNEAIVKKVNSWIGCYNLLFIDAPGTGYGFTDDDNGYAKNNTMVGKYLYDTLRQIAKLFIEQREAPLYLMSVSYGSKAAIAVALEAYNNCDTLLNLQGIIMFSPFIEAVTQFEFSKFGVQLGFLDKAQAKQIVQLENDARKALAAGDSAKAYQLHTQATAIFSTYSRIPTRLNLAVAKPTTFSNIGIYMQQPKIRKALHVGNTNFTSLGKVFENLKNDIMISVKDSLETIMDCYKVLICHGLLSTVSVIEPSLELYDSLDFYGAAEFKNATRQYWYKNGVLAGYYKSGGNFLLVEMLRAGQIVPMDQPGNARTLVTAFIQNTTLPSA